MQANQRYAPTESEKRVQSAKNTYHMKESQENERKSICFVIADEEIFFQRSQLIRHSPYIASLVQDLDS